MNPWLTAQSGTFAVLETLSRPDQALLSRYPELQEMHAKLEALAMALHRKRSVILCHVVQLMAVLERHASHEQPC